MRGLPVRRGDLATNPAPTITVPQLARPKLREVDLPTLKRLVAENEKQRYALKEDTDPLTGEENVLFIRANQGHSLKGVEELELERINDPTECPVVVHGTFARHWDSISEFGLLISTHCLSVHL